MFESIKNNINNMNYDTRMIFFGIVILVILIIIYFKVGAGKEGLESNSPSTVDSSATDSKVDTKTSTSDNTAAVEKVKEFVGKGTGVTKDRIELSVKNQWAAYSYDLTPGEAMGEDGPTSDYVPSCELDPDFVSSRERMGACTTKHLRRSKCMLDGFGESPLDDESGVKDSTRGGCSTVSTNEVYKVLYNN